MMATATLQPLDERLREAQTAVATAAKADVVDGQSLATSSALASTVSSNSEVVLRAFLTFVNLRCR